MAVGVIFFIAAILIIVIWIFVEFRRIRHKVFAFFLIGLILFLAVSSTVVFKDKDIDFKSISGITDASKLYLSWLGSVFSNMKTITINAVKMDWVSVNNSNNTIGALH